MAGDTNMLNIKKYLEKGNKAFAENDFSLAFSYFQQIINQDPKHYHAYLNAGNALCYMQRY